MHSPYLSFFIVCFVLGLGSALSVRSRKLTTIAGISAFLTGLAIYLGDGIAGLTMLGSFFILATLATAHKKERKRKLEPHAEEGRNAGQVFANGGIAALAGLLMFLFPLYSEALSLMLAAALSSATADTLASELGMVYGRHPFHILSFKREHPGPDGVVSIEGLLLGMAGALIIGIIYGFFHGFSIVSLIIILLSGTLGNLMDSLLGATLERKQVIGNNMVNLLNTLFAAFAAWLMYRVWNGAWV